MSMENQSSKKRNRDESVNSANSADSSSESEAGFPEVKRLRDDLLLGFFDEADPEPATQDLDSLMRSFEEEIATAAADPGESQPELGYLLEASDDELGLPPSGASNSRGEEVEESGEFGGGEIWRFDDQIPNYDAFELEGGGAFGGGDAAEYVAFDGLFEYSNLYLDASENSDFLWRQETLPAQ